VGSPTYHGAHTDSNVEARSTPLASFLPHTASRAHLTLINLWSAPARCEVTCQNIFHFSKLPIPLCLLPTTTTVHPGSTHAVFEYVGTRSSGLDECTCLDSKIPLVDITSLCNHFFFRKLPPKNHISSLEIITFYIEKINGQLATSRGRWVHVQRGGCVAPLAMSPAQCHMRHTLSSMLVLL
jgi:hypothetical protein